MRTYRAITKELKNDKQLSLEIYHTDMSGGVKNFRTAAIYEPDPYEGEVANPGSGLDQQFLHGPRRDRHNFSFRGKNAIQALNLLERTCNGKEGLRDKVQEGWDYRNIPYIHGYKSPKPGLDTWIFNGFQFKIQQKEDQGLFLDVTSKEFYVHGFPVSSKRIENVKEGLSLYEENIVDNFIIRNIQQGILLRKGISRHADLEINEKDLLELVNGTVTKEFLDKYQNALESLSPFNISEKAKKDLFTSMLLENFHFKIR